VERFDPHIYAVGAASDGSLVLDLNTDYTVGVDQAVGGGIQQTFPTIVDTFYILSFDGGTWLAAGRDGTRHIEVVIDDTSHPFTVTNLTGTIVWTRFPLTFQATAPNTTVVFRNFDSPSQTFSLLDNVSVVPASVTEVASTGTAVPGGTGVFTAFPHSPAMSATRTAFLGLGSAGEAGVYSWDRAIPPDPVQPIADLTTAIPGGAGTFSGFTDVAVSGNLVSFMGTGVDQAGIYVNDVTIPPSPVKVADLTTAIPQGAGSFTGFTSVSTSRRRTAFLGLGNFGQAGIYLASVLTKVIAVGDTLAGKVVTELRLGRFGLDGNSLAFGATFADGSEGVFVAQVALYPFTGFFALVANLPVFNQVKVGQAVPVKFSLQGNQGLAIFAPGYPKSAQIACNSDALVSGIEPTVAAGGSSLSYNATTDQYTYVWKTDQAWAKTCRQLVLELQDGSLHRANFTFK